MHVYISVIKNILIILGDNVLISKLSNIELNKLIFYNSIGTLIYLIIMKNKMSVFLNSNILCLISILPLMKYYNYKSLINGFILCGIIFYIFSMVKNINIKYIFNIFPYSVIGNIFLILSIELFKYILFNNYELIKYNIFIILFSIFITYILSILTNSYVIFSLIINYIIIYYLNLNIKYNKKVFDFNNIYRYNNNMLSIMNILPISFILVIEHIYYNFTFCNIYNKNLFKYINKSLFANSISIIFSSIFGSIPNTIINKNFILYYREKNIKYLNIYLSFILIFFSFIKKLNLLINNNKILNLIIISNCIFLSNILCFSSLKMIFNFSKNIFKSILYLLLNIIFYIFLPKYFKFINLNKILFQFIFLKLIDKFIIKNI